MILCLVLLFPTPDATTLIQNRFNTEDHVKKCPFVCSPRQVETNGSMTSICKTTGAL